MKLNEQEPLINDNAEPEINKNKNILLSTEIIKKEGSKFSDVSEISTDNSGKKITENAFKLLSIILIISSLFFFKKKLIYLKQNYLSDKSLFYFNIFYSEPKYNFLLFIILICCFTISTGFKLLLLQLISYILTLIIIISKNKISSNPNIFEKNLVVFHCSEIIISFLYLGEKLIQIYKSNSLNIYIIIIILFFNFNAIFYFILVEIINCQFNDIILELIWAMIINIILFYFIFYILKNKLLPKKITSFLFRYIFGTTFAFISILIFSFAVLFYFNELEYFFANKILMKIIGFFLYLLFEFMTIFKDKSDKSMKYFNLYNIYTNIYIYSKTDRIKLFLRVTIIILIEYFLLFKLDISYNTSMGIFKCIIIIILDICHSFIVMFIIKYIFNKMKLNNTELIEFNIDSSMLRYGSLSNLNSGDVIPPLIFE